MSIDDDPGLYTPEAMSIEYGIRVIYADGWFTRGRLWISPITHRMFHTLMGESVYEVVDFTKFKAFFFIEALSRNEEAS